MLGKELVEKLTGSGIDGLILNFHDARSRVFDLAERAKADPKAKGELEEARIAYALAEAALEKAKAEHKGLIALTGLLAAMTQAGKDTSALEASIQAVIKQETIQENVPSAAAQGQRQEDTETAVFTVLEVRAGKSPGVVRAYCQAADGTKHAVYAKNGNAQALTGAVGKAAEVKYRQGDKGLIALSVRLAG
ncbi:MAG: hypothetical protein K6U74_00410 [Firmicutes bacterium]|nr:hypothetical protein [Bacillota bacterium]